MGRYNTLSRVSRKLGISTLGIKAYAGILKSHIRVINYHDIPIDTLDQFETQIDLILSIYDPVLPDQLQALLDKKKKLTKPGVIFTFDDGFESHATYVADLLSRKGIVGWFFVPTAAPDVPVADHVSWAYKNLVFRGEPKEEKSDRMFATWDSWVKVSNNHIVASHTHDHVRFEPALAKENVKYQLERSGQLIEDYLSTPNRYFCYVGGELGSYSSHAAEAVRESGVELAFTTCSQVTVKDTNPFRIERTNIESHFSLDRVHMSLSGIVDLRYAIKRAKLDSCFSLD